LWQFWLSGFIDLFIQTVILVIMLIFVVGAGIAAMLLFGLTK
jgi:hypothetical protein